MGTSVRIRMHWRSLPPETPLLFGASIYNHPATIRTCCASVVRFGPVTSVPYWDKRCGMKFEGGADLLSTFDRFWFGVEAGLFAPREMIAEKFTLENRAMALVDKYGPVAS